MPEITDLFTPALAVALFAWLRNDIRKIHDQLNATAKHVNERLDTTAKGVNERLDATTKDINERLDTTTKGVNERLDATTKDFTGDLKELREDFTGDLRELREDFKDQFATKADFAKLETKVEAVSNRMLLALIAVAGLLFAALKLWP